MAKKDEVKYEIKQVEVHKKCPKCGKGHMIATGKMIAKETLQFPHKCDKCGHKENYTNTYPYSKYEYSEVKE